MKTANFLHHLIVWLACVHCGANALAQDSTAEVNKQTQPAVAVEPSASPSQDIEASIPDIAGTWSRAESGTFSKLTIRPVENRNEMFFVEYDAGNGLLKSSGLNGGFQGAFSFNLLTNRSIGVEFKPGASDTGRITVTWMADYEQKKLLRGGFAKTQRELDQKLSSDWKRVESAAEPKPKDTVAVVKTEYAPIRICELLRARYLDQPYRFFWNGTAFSHDTFHSVIVLAPADAQDDIEAAIHQFDVAEIPSPTAAPAVAVQGPVDTTMPDISGSWYFNQTEEGPLNPTRAVIRHLPDGSAHFVIEIADEVSWPRLKWNQDAGCFDAEVLDRDHQKVTEFTATLTKDGR